MESSFTHAFLFLLNIVFGIAIYCVLLRLLLQYFKVDFSHSACQFLVKVTNPVLKPLRKVIPGFYGIDLSALLVALILQVVFFVIMSHFLGTVPWGIVLYGSVFRVIDRILNVFFYAIIIEVILSWVATGEHPIASVLNTLTAPLLAPIRRRLPLVSGFDFSPFIVLVIIHIIQILLAGLYFSAY